VVLWLLLALLLLWLVGRTPRFYSAYMQHMQTLEDDAWLRTQCQDPIFVSRMMRHHDVCERVRESFRQPAFLVALQACCVPSEWQALMPSVGWETVCLVSFILLLAPGILLPLYRMQKDRVDHARMLEACSPDLPFPWRYAKPPRRRHQAYLMQSNPSTAICDEDIFMS
jgi:hypothetical protein